MLNSSLILLIIWGFYVKWYIYNNYNICVI